MHDVSKNLYNNEYINVNELKLKTIFTNIKDYTWLNRVMFLNYMET